MVVVLLIAALFLLDFIMKRVNHISTVVAPMSILLTFSQTAAVLLDLDVPWPPALRQWLSTLNVFNLNLQMMRPECTMEFGLYASVSFTLLMPLALAFVLAIYIAMQFSLARKDTTAQFQRNHEGKSVRRYLAEQGILILASVFVFGSIFFLRTVLQVFNCEIDDATGKQYLRAQPEVECQFEHNDDKYISMYALGWIGVVMYAIMFALVGYGLTVEKDMFGFLGGARPVFERPATAAAAAADAAGAAGAAAAAAAVRRRRRRRRRRCVLTRAVLALQTSLRMSFTGGRSCSWLARCY
jgi:hypothetical protein